MKRGLRKKRDIKRVGKKFNKWWYVFLALIIILAICLAFFAMNNITGDAVKSNKALLSTCNDSDNTAGDSGSGASYYIPSYVSVKGKVFGITLRYYDKKVCTSSSSCTLSEVYCTDKGRVSRLKKSCSPPRGDGFISSIVGPKKKTAWACKPCAPKCTGKECGDDGCGGSCGECDSASKESCESNQCVPCVRNCGTRKCGPDPGGCGTYCGDAVCAGGKECSSLGVCEVLPLSAPEEVVSNLSGRNVSLSWSKVNRATLYHYECKISNSDWTADSTGDVTGLKASFIAQRGTYDCSVVAKTDTQTSPSTKAAPSPFFVA
jgi:hypothetical protein